MKKSILLLSMLLMGFVGYSQQLTTPTVSFTNAYSPSTSVTFQVNDTNANETGFEIQYGPIGGTMLTLTKGTNETSFPFTLSGLTPATKYIVKVRAIAPTPSAITNSAWSGPDYFTTSKAAPGGPTLQSGVSPCNNNITVSWTAPTTGGAVENYTVQRSYDGSTWNDVTSVPPTNFSAYDANPWNIGKTVYYRVVATNINSFSSVTQYGFSNVITTFWPGLVNPNPPINLQSIKTKRTTTSLTVLWVGGDQDPCGYNKRTDYYIRYKVLGKDTDYKLFETVYPFTVTETITGLSPKDVVDIEVVAINMDSPSFHSSAVVRDTTLGPPFAPSNLTVTSFKDALSNSGFNLKWMDNSNDEDYFIVESSLNGADFKQIGKINKNNTTFVNDPIEEGLPYVYRLKAGNVYGESKYATSTAITQDYTAAPSAPFDTYAKVSGTSVLVGWTDASTNESGFTVERSTDGIAFSQIGTTARSVATYTDAAPVSGKTNYYRVKATNPLGSSTYGKVASVVFGSASGVVNNDLGVFPNPTFDYFTIATASSLKGKDVKVDIYNENNRLIYSKVYQNVDSEIKVAGSALQSGILNVVITSDDFKSTKRVVRY